ncbi:MAG: D-glycero-beta-D-manno-heptose,7-bisphosphate 7-phosphatase, partial [Rhodoferax sp.]|nr:D-glycero-beta-D-manno-heptose,7-bisphosphate 7-phosphatase [Rhodoferax sp.]
VLTGKGAAYAGQPLPAQFPANTIVHDDLPGFAQFIVEREAAFRKPPSP